MTSFVPSVGLCDGGWLATCRSSRRFPCACLSFACLLQYLSAQGVFVDFPSVCLFAEPCLSFVFARRFRNNSQPYNGSNRTQTSKDTTQVPNPATSQKSTLLTQIDKFRNAQIMSNPHGGAGAAGRSPRGELVPSGASDSACSFFPLTVLDRASRTY